MFFFVFPKFMIFSLVQLSHPCFWSTVGRKTLRSENENRTIGWERWVNCNIFSLFQFLKENPPFCLPIILFSFSAMFGRKLEMDSERLAPLSTIVSPEYDSWLEYDCVHEYDSCLEYVSCSWVRFHPWVWLFPWVRYCPMSTILGLNVCLKWQGTLQKHQKLEKFSMYLVSAKLL